MAKETYHHGDLRRALLAAAAAAIGEHGPAALSLRDLSRRAGVSHAAPTHHFGDKAGLLTALATEGYELLAADLTAEWAASHSLLEQGVAYVGFAIRHRAHFEVMFRPDLHHADDPALVTARELAAAALYAGVTDTSLSVAGSGPAGGGLMGWGSAEVWERGLAAWSIAHGFATLWVSGALPEAAGSPDELARAVLARLSPPEDDAGE